MFSPDYSTTIKSSKILRKTDIIFEVNLAAPYKSYLENKSFLSGQKSAVTKIFEKDVAAKQFDSMRYLPTEAPEVVKPKRPQSVNKTRTNKEACK